MCSSARQPGSKAPAISLQGVGKVFYRFERPLDRLLLQLPRLSRLARFDTITGLQPLDLSIAPGEVVGLVGRNGAGKSTLLQLVCNTLTPSSGRVEINGKIAALLELGSGFNPEFTGRENVYMSAAIAGLSRAQIDERFEEIHDFAGIGDFIDQPVKTYSSGMYVRLAFAVAVTVEPDILVIDEALSVGDGAFARKSFDRIMQLKEQGKTILFCSHNLYQVEAICNRALWLHQGQVAAEGVPAEVIHRYENYLYALDHDDKAQPEAPRASTMEGQPKLTQVTVTLDDKPASLSEIPLGATGRSQLTIEAQWQNVPGLPAPSFAATVHTGDSRVVGSAGSHIDATRLPCDEQGMGRTRLVFPALPLLKGEYWVEVYLLCEQGVLFYDQRVPAARFRMASPAFSLEQGVVHLERVWS